MEELCTANFIKERQIIKLKFPLRMEIIRALVKFPHFNQIGDSWEIQPSEEVISTLKSLGFIFSKSLVNWNQEEKVEVKITTISNLQLKPYPYQIEGVNFIESKNGRALIADEMGLGKTIQALMWLQHHEEIRPALIICPASLKINWQRESLKWAPNSSPEILSGTFPYKTYGNILIINYDILSDWLEELKSKNFLAIIVDEAQKIKNNNAKRTKAFKRLIKGVPHLIGLTGTPIENKPAEIYNIVHSINSNIFPNFIDFITEFCGAKRGFYGWEYGKPTNTKRLHKILTSSVMIRRKKADVLKDLPPKQIVKVPIEIDNAKEYFKAEEEFIRFVQEKFTINLNDEVKEELKNFAKENKIDVSEELTENEISFLAANKIQRVTAAPFLTQIESLKQLSVKGKMKLIIEWIETFLESGEKLIVFAIHKKVINTLMDHFKGSVKIDGSCSPKQKQDAMDKFQGNSKIQLLIGNINAAGVGITLTASSNAAIIEFPWNPSDIMQAEDRIHRITQTKQVTIWKLVSVNTIEERILNILSKKEQNISKILDGKSFNDSSVIMDLIETYKQIKITK